MEGMNTFGPRPGSTKQTKKRAAKKATAKTTRVVAFFITQRIKVQF